MEPWLITLLLFGSLISGLCAGLPIAFVLSGVGVFFTFLLWGPQGLLMISSTAYGKGTDFVLIALPLFLLMANFLKVSGIGDELFGMIHRLLGRLPGGLATGTVIVCAIFAAMVGISGVATVTMGLIAIPAMLKRNYNKSLAIGTVGAGGALGILIPPSIIAIIYGSATGVSIGKLFIAGFIPGILLSLMFIAYITVRCIIQPHLGPPSPEKFSLREKIVSIKGLIVPLLIIILVLGTIYFGICTPTESAAIGAVGSFIFILLQNRLTWAKFTKALFDCFAITCMCMWIVFGAGCFSNIYNALGAPDLLIDLIQSLNPSPIVVIWIMEFIYIILGCFLDPAGICLITVPIFVPIIVFLGYDPLWFGIVFIVNMEMAYLTPPFGFNLFYLKGVVPPGITMSDIYRSVLPFIIIQFICLALVVHFPQLGLWLPNLMSGR